MTEERTPFALRASHNNDTPPRRVYRLVDKINPEDYFSDSKKHQKLDNSEFDKGLFREFFDKSLREPPSVHQMGDNYEVVIVNQSIHFSRLGADESVRDPSLLHILESASPADADRAAGPEEGFLRTLQQLEQAAPGLRLGDGDRALLGEALAKAVQIVRDAQLTEAVSVLTFGQFLKRRVDERNRPAPRPFL